MDDAYYVQGAIFKLSVNIMSFNPLEDPQMLVLLLPLFIGEKTKAQGG